MYINNDNDVLKKIPCYVVGNKLARFLINNKKIPILSIRGDRYYFRKNDLTDRIFKGEIPFYYKWFTKIEKRGGEEN